MTLPAFNIEAGLAEWSSFMPALLACLHATSGDVLEVGVGHYSTPVLHEYCAAHGRWLVSCEEDDEWGRLFAHQFTSLRHSFVMGGYDEIIRLFVERDTHWSVIFLDHSPGPRRAADMMLLIDRAQFVVVHDYHLAIAAAFAPLVAGLNCHVVQSVPPTAVFSRGGNIPPEVLAL